VGDESGYGWGVRDYLQIHLVVLAWGFTAILGRWIDMPPVDLVIWRAGLAALGFWVVALVTGKRLLGERRRALGLMAVGFLLGWHWVLFFLSARMATVSVSLAAMPTAMLWCSLIEPLVNGSRRWSRAELVVGGVMVGAVWLIYQVEFSHWQGFTVGLAAAVLAAFYSVLTKQLVVRWPGSVIGFYQLTGALLGVLIGLPWIGGEGGVQWPASGDWIGLVVLAWVCTVGAYLGYLDALTRVSVFTVNVIYNLEPVYGIVLALLFFGEAERMSPGFYVGAGIIVVVVLGMPWARQRKRPTPVV
jgi:drug/metabolite transporter (DMT)-like permease